MQYRFASNTDICYMHACRWRTYASAYPVENLITPEDELDKEEGDEAALRAKIISMREEIYNATSLELQKIQSYESIVLIPYLFFPFICWHLHSMCESINIVKGKALLSCEVYAWRSVIHLAPVSELSWERRRHTKNNQIIWEMPRTLRTCFIKIVNIYVEVR